MYELKQHNDKTGKKYGTEKYTYLLLGGNIIPTLLFAG